MIANTSRIGRVARPEIEKLADLTFGVSRDRIHADADEKRRQVLHRVRQTGNSGGYVPGLVRLAEERVREMVLARADAYVDAFSVHGMACDALAEASFRTTSQQIAAGAISALLGEFSLNSVRTRRPNGVAAGYANRQIAAAMTSAIQESLLRLKRQDAIARASVPVPSPPSSQANEFAEPSSLDDLEMMRRIDKWHKSSGPNGGKLTQKEVASALQLDLRAYTAAKSGKPRGQDHFQRIRKFATDSGII